MFLLLLLLTVYFCTPSLPPFAWRFIRFAVLYSVGILPTQHSLIYPHMLSYTTETNLRPPHLSGNFSLLAALLL